MQFIGDHFWKIIFLIVVSVAGVWSYQRYDKKQNWIELKARYQAIYQEIPTSPESDDAECKGKYLTFLAMVNQFRVNLTNDYVQAFPPAAERHTDAKPTLDDHTKWMLDGALGVPEDSPRTPLAEVVQAAIFKNLKLCEQFGIFDGEENMKLMLKGKNPLISKGSFSGEPLVVVQRIPVFAARQVAHHPANYTLIPESLAAVQAETLDDSVRSLADKFKHASILSQQSYDRLKSVVELLKN